MVEKESMTKANILGTKDYAKHKNAITLMALIITIIILLILAGVSISILIGENGLLNITKNTKSEHEKQTAIEILKLKIAECQMQSVAENTKYPTLSYLAAFLQKDKEQIGDIEYVLNQSVSLAALDDTPYIGWKKIYTKLAKYPYEFEINDNFQVSVNGEQVEIPVGYMKIPTETKEISITENGTIQEDVKDYANIKINTNVPNTIPDDYMKKPTQENVKITEARKNIDVTNYKSIDTSSLYVSQGTGENTNWARGTAQVVKGNASFNVGFVPSSTTIWFSSSTDDMIISMKGVNDSDLITGAGFYSISAGSNDWFWRKTLKEIPSIYFENGKWNITGFEERMTGTLEWYAIK